MLRERQERQFALPFGHIMARGESLNHRDTKAPRKTTPKSVYAKLIGEQQRSARSRETFQKASSEPLRLCGESELKFFQPLTQWAAKILTLQRELDRGFQKAKFVARIVALALETKPINLLVLQ